MHFIAARSKFPFAMLWPQPRPSKKSESEFSAVIRLASLLLKCGILS
jgi:hypothetical protein